MVLFGHLFQYFITILYVAHYKLAIIHPFKDGNGRTSRLLLNLILLHRGYPPVVVRLDDRSEYYKALKLANAGDIRPFIRFVANCTDTTMTWFMQAIERIHNSHTIDQINKDSSHEISYEGVESKQSASVILGDATDAENPKDLLMTAKPYTQPQCPMVGEDGDCLSDQ